MRKIKDIRERMFRIITRHRKMNLVMKGVTGIECVTQPYSHVVASYSYGIQGLFTLFPTYFYSTLFPTLICGKNNISSPNPYHYLIN
jgi:hypothetical protein